MNQPNSITRGTFRLAMVCTLLTVIGGSVVCATESGLACPTWPGCHPGQPFPGLSLPSWIEFGHRTVSAACLLSLVMAGLSVWRSHREDPWVRWLPWVAVLAAIAAAVFGMSIVLWGIGPELASIDLLSSLIALIAITAATIALERGGFRWVWSPAAIQASLVVVLLVVLHVLGVLAAGAQSFTRCMGWPLLALLSYDGHAGLQVVRWSVAVMALICLGVTIWMTKGRNRFALAALALVAVEIVLGVVLLTQGISYVLAAVYSILAVLVLWLATLAAADNGLRK